MTRSRLNRRRAELVFVVHRALSLGATQLLVHNQAWDVTS